MLRFIKWLSGLQVSVSWWSVVGGRWSGIGIGHRASSSGSGDRFSSKNFLLGSPTTDHRPPTHGPRTPDPGPRILLLLLLLTALLLSGCEVESKGEAGPLAIPPKENVRVLARKIEDPANAVHWKWSVIGERNWSEATITDTPEITVALDKPSPMSDPAKRGGCNIWEVDFTAKAAEGGTAWKARIHGSDGTTVEKEGILSGASNPSEALHVLQEKDTVAKLPAQISLARLGEKTVTFRIAR